MPRLPSLKRYLHSGDNRQLYPWELARESDDGSSYYGSDTSSPTMVDLEGGKFGDEEKRGSVDKTDSRRNSAFSFPDMHYFPLPPSPASLSDKSVTSSSGKSSTTPSGLYFAPAALNESLPKSSRVWAPFCKQVSGRSSDSCYFLLTRSSLPDLAHRCSRAARHRARRCWVRCSRDGPDSRHLSRCS